MPTTSPAALTSGPPELPGFAAASNWMRFERRRSPSGDWYSRFRPEITPCDTEGPMPNGKPMAVTCSPSIRCLAERKVAACRSSGICFACSTARSFSGWVLMIAASDSRPSSNCTRTRLAPATTCRLVRITPLSMITTPLPVARCMYSSYSRPSPIARTRTIELRTAW